MAQRDIIQQNRNKQNIQGTQPLLTFWPPGPPLLAKLTVTWSETKKTKAITFLSPFGHFCFKLTKG